MLVVVFSDLALGHKTSILVAMHWSTFYLFIHFLQFIDLKILIFSHSFFSALRTMQIGANDGDDSNKDKRRNRSTKF